MKLRNKQTGDIGVLNVWNDKYHVIAYGLPLCDNSVLGEYDTLDALMQEWEDYEEPLIYYVINEFGVIESYPVGCISDEDRKLIGNYFTTKEEAEKAVEKLKAWQRLKDKGLRFDGVEEKYKGCLGDFTIYCYVKPDFTRKFDDIKADLDLLKADLDLLFGGEE